VRVAVLGASGFVGSHLVRILREYGDDVRPVVRSGKSAAADPAARLADATDVYALRDAFRGCDYVVHSVLGSPDVILGSLAPMYAAAQAVGVSRIVYLSTGSVHGQTPPPGASEASDLHVHHLFAYNNAKVRAERKLRRLRARGTVEAVTLRPTIVFGPGSRWVSDFAAALREGTAYVVDRGSGICNSIYVDNLGYAVRLALNTPHVNGETFLVSDAETVTWADLYRPLAAGLGFDFDAVPSVSPPDPVLTFKHRYIEPFRTSKAGATILRNVPSSAKTGLRRVVRLVRPRRGAAAQTTTVTSAGPAPTAEMIMLHRCRWRLPIDKAVRLLGYAPPVSFDEGCRRSVDWLRQSDHGRIAAGE
jgi:nucleoside-diphosphate-sugar epimerase